MTRPRYEPPAAEASTAVLPVAAPFAFKRASHGEIVPWVLGEVAANSMPPSTAPTEEDLAEQRAVAVREGLAAGRAQAEAELAELREKFIEDAQASLAALASTRREIIEACRAELAELAATIAEAVVQREITEGRAGVDVFVRQALLEMDPHERCTISVAAAEAGAVSEWASAGWPGAIVRPDPSLRTGELRVAAASGNIEVDVAQRIARIRRMVLGEDETP